MLNKENLKDIYPLSPMQASMLFYALLNPDSDAYFEQITLHITGQFEVALWQKSWQLLVQRHDILRTVFNYKKTDQPLQIVLKQSDPEFSYTDLRHLHQSEQQQQISQYKQQDRQRNFKLTHDKLTRIALFQCQPNDYIMVWSFPHILLDAWCNGIIYQELLSSYQTLKQGKIPNLPPAPPYNRYIQWLAKQDKTATAHYWHSYLDGYAQLTGIPKEKFLASPEPLPPFADHEIHFDAEISQQLRDLATQYQVTLNVIVQAAWGVLLQIYNGVTDAVFAMVVSGRPATLPEVERTLGLFINSIPVRVRCHATTTVSELLQQLHHDNLASKSYDFYPLFEIQNLSPLKHNLLDHLMIFESAPTAIQENEEQHVGFSIVQQEIYERIPYDLVLMVFPEENLTIRFNYNPSVYRAEQISRIAAQCQQLLQQFLADPARPINRLDILPESEQQQLLQQFNPTVDAPVNEATLMSWFERQVTETPDKIAIRCEQQQLTYQQLNTQANQVAHLLRQHYAVQPDDRIAVLLDRSLDLVVALWGILKAGAAYVPLDPNYPAPRIQYVLDHSQSKLVLTQANYLNQWKNINAVEFATLLHPALPTENLPILTQPHHLAYVIYTSGSTGLPKGVMLMHRNVVSFCNNLSKRYGFMANDVLYAVTTVTFDISVLELLGSLLLGMQVVVAKEESTKDPRKIAHELKECSVLQTTPSRLQMIIESEGVRALSHLRVILVGGEALSQSLFDLLRSLPHTHVFNVYGPTETAIWSTTKLLNDKLLTIGNPLEHEAVYILGDNLQLLPIGVIGEVCIGGAGVSRGYWRDEQKTQQQFVPNPFRPGESLYKTGDLGRWLSNGEIEFLGRKDFQVKVRGFRIELGEIEHRLIQVATVRQAVVVAHEGNLVAYLVVDEPVQVADLKKYLLEWLPDYMVPTHFVTVDALPLTPNGKIDRKALPKLENFSTDTSNYVAPRNELEQQLAVIWHRVLGVAQVGIRDNFFELGGHSLKAVQLLTQLRQQYHQEISLTQFFQQPTIEGLVRQLNSENLGITRLNPSLPQAKTAIICFPPLLGYGLIFQPLCAALPEYAWYAVDFVENVPNLLEHYLKQLFALNLEHYVLLGFSAGGVVALQLAKNLEQRGKVVTVILLDALRLEPNQPLSDQEREYHIERDLQSFFTESMGKREDVKRRMHGYADFVLSLASSEIIQADIYYLQAEGSAVEDWRTATLGNYFHYSGFGGHFDLLNPRYVAQNAEVMQQMLKNIK